MRDDARRMQRLERSDDLLALDWTSVGRLVRRTTLEAVALHFAEIGAQSTGPKSGAGAGRIEEFRNR